MIAGSDTRVVGALVLRQLSPDHVREHLAAYIAISADASPWTADHFLKELPGKWDLSFALWDALPIAYCIMSRRAGAIHINQFMVAPNRRGCGIGARMLAECINRGASTLKVDPKNEGAIRFYLKYGFARAGEENGYLVMARSDLTSVGQNST